MACPNRSEELLGCRQVSVYRSFDEEKEKMGESVPSDTCSSMVIIRPLQLTNDADDTFASANACCCCQREDEETSFGSYAYHMSIIRRALYDPSCFLQKESYASCRAAYNQMAFAALVLVREYLKNIPVSDTQLQTGYGFFNSYIDRLQGPFFNLMKGEYCKVCRDLLGFFESYDVTQRRIRDAIVMLLNRVSGREKDESMATGEPVRYFENEFEVIQSHITSDPAYMEAAAPQRIHYLEFCIEVLKSNMLGETVGTFLNCKGEFTTPVLFPYLHLPRVEKNKRVSFDGYTVLTYPCNTQSTLEASDNIANNGFLYDQNGFHGICFEDIKLIVMNDGRHHSAVASLLGGGEALVDVYRLCDGFGKISTDGKYWYVGSDKSEKTRVFDTRMALIYWMCEEASRLKRQVDSGET